MYNKEKVTVDMLRFSVRCSIHGQSVQCQNLVTIRGKAVLYFQKIFNMKSFFFFFGFLVTICNFMKEKKKRRAGEGPTATLILVYVIKVTCFVNVS